MPDLASCIASVGNRAAPNRRNIILKNPQFHCFQEITSSPKQALLGSQECKNKCLWPLVFFLSQLSQIYTLEFPLAIAYDGLI